MTNSNRINHKSNKFSSYKKLITLKQFVKFEDNKLLYLFSDILKFDKKVNYVWNSWLHWRTSGG